MNTVWACLCAGDILLRKGAEDGAFSLPTGDEPPVPLKPWNVVTKLEIKDDRLKMKDSQAQPSLISNLSSLIFNLFSAALYLPDIPLYRYPVIPPGRSPYNP